MPPRTALSTPLRAWRCPQCTNRAFSITARAQAVGPEHPRYLPIQEPPQQTLPDRKFIKGRLPVPRDIFVGARGQDKSEDAWLEKAIQTPQRQSTAKAGSREEWKAKMSEMRRENLRAGLKSLRIRRTRDEDRRRERSERRQREHEELVSRPEREDERLTAPSHGLDLETLYKGDVTDPTRTARLEQKRLNLQAQTEKSQDERLSALNTLYLRARSFIVTPQQLDKAVDEAFGTTENPVSFVNVEQRDVGSVWAYGRPEKVQDMLNRANRVGGRSAMSASGSAGYSSINKERIRKIAEVLTEGKIAS
ncbi:Hypothetical protein R9X50_00044300 [Acrodontium crateriforme]|uniref:Uncharacterized protein n=1 Tax=Acrodontium crateriforme TaxID=150365 RepID=A0AAQ3LXA6_9PEZI|nr:Hypothetical protein R9X50_00044300 [Acrodontium crateriforme]